MGNGAGHTDSAAWHRVRRRLSGCAVLLLLLLLLLCVNLGSEPAKGDEFRRLEALRPMRLRRLIDKTDDPLFVVGVVFAIISIGILIKFTLSLKKFLLFYKDPRDWAVYIFHDADADTPKASFTNFGAKFIIRPVGQCIKGSPCYDVPDTNLKKPFIFSFNSQMRNPMINGYSVPEGKKGVFVFNKGKWKPLEEFDGLVHPWSKLTEEQPIKSHLVTFHGDSPKKGFILEYEMAPLAALLKKGLLETTDSRISKLKMTPSYLPDLTWTYVCQPAIPPGYTLTRLRVLDGDQMLFNSEVEQENLPFVLRIRQESSKIRYGVDGRQEPIPQTFSLTISN